MIDDVRLAASTIVPVSAYVSPWAVFKKGSTAGSAPCVRSTTKCPRARKPMSLACGRTRATGPGPQPKGVPGLYHVAFEVGETSDDLAAARRHVVARGLDPFGEYANGFCVRDPDGHEVELYVEPARAISERR